MVQAGTASRTLTRAERTRASILVAAETLFAERGFAETRLEDVAAAVGIRRASIVYYFADKPALYDAVLADVFGGLLARVEPVLLGAGTLAERAIAAVSTWIDYVAGRPSTARILLREVADGRVGREPPLVRHTRAFSALIGHVLEASANDASAVPSHVDAVHLASVVTGSTVFFVAAMPVLLPGEGFEPLQRERLEGHRSEVLDIVRRLLGAPPS
ncbi:MAG: TetR/AcrR family transcriptional regulator [Deltaproteobacteria bacterium]|nr:TetR/AcrR family transcriptional regulator [Deltaproteobacteria bacterium]